MKKETQRRTLLPTRERLAPFVVTPDRVTSRFSGVSTVHWETGGKKQSGGETFKFVLKSKTHFLSSSSIIYLISATCTMIVGA